MCGMRLGSDTLGAPFVEFSGVTRQWDGQGGVADISLAVPRGSFVSVLGPSGCGKSTLLRLLAGLERPQAGEIRIEGRDVTHAPAARRGLSMVFQSYALFPHLSVAENIQFGLKVRRVRAADRARQLSEAVAMVGLAGYERRKPAELSGGQRQRVALARAIVSGHPLCLMDEPLSNLDAKLRHSVRRDIKGLQRRLGLTVVYVTHDQSEAMSLSDKVILMRDGRIVQAGSPQALYEKPADVFAAEFIGDPPMAVVEAAALGLQPGIRVGIRVEQIRPAGAGITPDLTAPISEIEFLGGHTRLFLDHPQARGLGLILDGPARYAVGQQIGLSLPPECRVLFDGQDARTEKDPAALRDGSRQTAVSR
jgi:sn-glycerol 3-phosphate transport system ATP-binding protein